MEPNLEDAIAYVRKKLLETGRSLSQTEQIALEAAWKDLTYGQLSKEYGVSFRTLQNHAGPRLWQELTRLFEKRVGKKNLRKFLIERMRAESRRDAYIEDDSIEKKGDLLFAGAVLPPTDNFVGREKEIARLVEFIDRMPFVLVLGLEGIGKRSLISRTLSNRHFDLPLNRTLWKTLHHCPSAKELEVEILSAIGADEDEDLLERLRVEPFLIVLDSLNSLLTRKECIYSLDSQYVSLLRRITEETPSRVVAISNQTIREIEALVIRGQAILYSLRGVTMTEAESILGASWDRQAAKEVWKSVGGNPLMLQELANWSEYASELSPQVHRLSLLGGLLGNFYERIVKSALLSTSDLALLRSIAEYTQGIAFSKLLSESPKSAPGIKKLVDMGLADKASDDSKRAVIQVAPLMGQALLSQT
ncbi:MAG: hypothetical protein WA947_08405 [Phormidesmis sp.]